MKTLNKIILLFALILTGCPKNNNSTDQNLNNNAFAQCINCSGMVNGTEFMMTESNEYNNMFVLRLAFSGSSGVPNYGAYYNGAAAVSRGELVVNQNFGQGYCYIPAGTYSMGTLEVGQYASGIFQNIRMVAQGPALVVIRMLNGQISSQNNRDPYGQLLPTQRLFSTNTVVESVNGQACNFPVTLR